MKVLVPSTPALLPEYFGVVDPVPAVREACRLAVARLVATCPSAVSVSAPVGPDAAARGVREPAGARIGRQLLAEAGFRGEPAAAPRPDAGVLVVGNGTARRSEKAPGHLDERSFAFDDALGRALREGDGRALAALDRGLAEELWCHDAPALQVLGGLLDGRPGTVWYDGDPYGVQYWVVTWP